MNAGSAGPTDGITIVGGHEFAETETDIFPSTGWLDGSGSEIGDKCFRRFRLNWSGLPIAVFRLLCMKPIFAWPSA